MLALISTHALRRCTPCIGTEGSPFLLNALGRPFPLSDGLPVASPFQNTETARSFVDFRGFGQDRPVSAASVARPLALRGRQPCLSLEFTPGFNYAQRCPFGGVRLRLPEELANVACPAKPSLNVDREGVVDFTWTIGVLPPLSQPLFIRKDPVRLEGGELTACFKHFIRTRPMGAFDLTVLRLSKLKWLDDADVGGKDFS